MTGSTSDPNVGRWVARRFRIDRLLAVGAMGRVYLAEQTSLGKMVALKVLHTERLADPTLVKRFHIEAKSASLLSHPNVLSLIDFGEDDGLLFIAMELLEGRSLARIISDERPLPTARVVHIGAQVLAALEEAHDKGVVHRDVKPENVIVLDAPGEPDFVKVCDFGLAKLAGGDRNQISGVTAAGRVCGTPEYMSPEQARGEPLDGRSDLYAVAVILYQMVVGDLPFRANEPVDVMRKHVSERVPRPSARAPVD